MLAERFLTSASTHAQLKKTFDSILAWVFQNLDKINAHLRWTSMI